MIRTTTMLAKALLFAIPLAAALTLSGPGEARAEVVVRFPPAEFVATFQPEYYGGHAVYWYGNRWFYRDGTTWRYYRTEPVYLRERRSHWTGDRYRWRYHR